MTINTTNQLTYLFAILITSASAYNNEQVAPTMVSIPAGNFIMGCLQEAPCPPEEMPLSPINIHSFAISKHEITFSQWDQCYNDQGCDHSPSDNGWGRDNRPVININWHDTQQYLKWLSKKEGKIFRLPTEAEWEYAARAGSKTATPYGNCIQPSHANFDSRVGYTALACEYELSYTGQTAPVGSYPENDYGLTDMIGNVSEWTLGCATKNYSQPETTETCKQRVSRGGSWDSLRWDARSAARLNTPAHERNSTTGFRIVHPL